jgi:hypothetical protein
MPCLGLKISAGTQSAALTLTAVVAVKGAPTAIGSAAAFATMAVQFAGLFGALTLLASCLDAHDRHEDAESLRRELDELKREIESMPH